MRQQTTSSSLPVLYNWLQKRDLSTMDPPPDGNLSKYVITVSTVASQSMQTCSLGHCEEKLEKNSWILN